MDTDGLVLSAAFPNVKGLTKVTKDQIVNQHKKLYNPEKEARLQIIKSKSDLIDYKIGELQHKLLWAELDAGLFGRANELSAG